MLPPRLEHFLFADDFILEERTRSPSIIRMLFPPISVTGAGTLPRLAIIAVYSDMKGVESLALDLAIDGPGGKRFSMRAYEGPHDPARDFFTFGQVLAGLPVPESCTYRFELTNRSSGRPAVVHTRLFEITLETAK